MISSGLSPKQKRRNLTPLLILILLYPYIIGFSSDSTSSYFEILAGAGTGQYVYHDCSGAHSQRFNDAGITITKKFEGPYRIGITGGGWTAGGTRDGAFVFPDLALDWEPFSLGTTGIRIGQRKSLYFESRWLDQPPFYSGKGLVRAGFGGPVGEKGDRIWVGGNIGPYNNPGFAMHWESVYSERTFLFLNGRIGSSEGMNEFGISLGFRYITP